MRKATFYTDPDDAAREDVKRALAMTHEERCAALTKLLREKGRWHEGKIERVFQIIEVAKS